MSFFNKINVYSHVHDVTIRRESPNYPLRD
jgi:hypothetical protein